MDGVGWASTYTPVSKFRSSVSATTAVAAWTPTTSTRIVLTDLLVSAAAAGTIQFRYGNVGGTVVAEFLSSGSFAIQWSPTTARYNPTYDQALFMETGFNGYVSVTAGGWEQE